ncbi:MAG: polyphosphate kinase 2 [Gammaproteobacteria bacterium]|nr:polyphosphate kinase 2 [Gammaproteobacteria bacterium]
MPNNDKSFKNTLRELQIELVRFQHDLIATDKKLLVILEGRDAAGKDGTIKCIVEHLSPRETRVVALSKPSDRECGSWYFQRYVAHLPAAGELVLFNRSWYNRAGVERVMGFCTDEDYRAFMDTVIEFESMLVRSGIQLLKYYLDIERDTQRERLAERSTDPLKQWKRSPIDDSAQERWDDYSAARNAMLARTHHPLAPWVVVRADHKRKARLELIRDLLSRQGYSGKRDALLLPDRDRIFEYDPVYLERDLIAR